MRCIFFDEKLMTNSCKSFTSTVCRFALNVQARKPNRNSLVLKTNTYVAFVEGSKLFFTIGMRSNNIGIDFHDSRFQVAFVKYLVVHIQSLALWISSRD